jgi:hypothetical protein
MDGAESTDGTVVATPARPGEPSSIMIDGKVAHVCGRDLRTQNWQSARHGRSPRDHSCLGGDLVRSASRSGNHLTCPDVILSSAPQSACHDRWAFPFAVRLDRPFSGDSFDPPERRTRSISASIEPGAMPS